MDEKDRERLIEVHCDVKYLRQKYEEDIPPLKALVATHEKKFTQLGRDKWWLVVIVLALWGGTVAFFDGIWEKFLK